MDLACRYGGEEFVVIMPETTQALAHAAGERIRQLIERDALRHRPRRPAAGDHERRRRHRHPAGRHGRRPAEAGGRGALPRQVGNGRNLIEIEELGVDLGPEPARNQASRRLNFARSAVHICGHGRLHPRRLARRGQAQISRRGLRGAEARPFRRVRRHAPQDRARGPALLECRDAGSLLRRRNGAEKMEADQRDENDALGCWRRASRRPCRACASLSSADPDEPQPPEIVRGAACRRRVTPPEPAAPPTPAAAASVTAHRLSPVRHAGRGDPLPTDPGSTLSLDGKPIAVADASGPGDHRPDAHAAVARRHRLRRYRRKPRLSRAPRRRAPWST